MHVRVMCPSQRKQLSTKSLGVLGVYTFHKLKEYISGSPMYVTQ